LFKNMLRFLSGAIAGWALFGVLAFGQAGTGEIAGTVKDTSGAVLPGVKLTIIHRERQLSREWTTGNDSGFFASALPAANIPSRPS
jgi:hypothetical protein